MDAVWHQNRALLVVCTATVLFVQVPAANLGVKDLAAVLILQLVQAAFRTAVAQRLPLGFRKIAESLGIPPIG